VTIKTIAVACALTVAAASQAAAPAGAPADANGLCKDGSYSTSASKKGACKGHKGVKQWWGSAESKPEKKSAKADKTTKSEKTEAASAPAAAPAEAPEQKSKPAATTVAKAAPGAGADKVWVNTESKVYHCSGDRWYGKTKQGEYMTEADATAKGYRADRGKACK
jgi:Protein of unknown function (DUF3761)